MKEIEFVNYWLKNIKGQSVTTEKINKAYSILYGIEATDNCNACIQTRINDLMNKMTTLIKLDFVQEGLQKIKEPVKEKKTTYKYPKDMIDYTAFGQDSTT
jgi:biotin synthase-related radical SAM superfamily protein